MKITNAFDGSKAKVGDEVYSLMHGKGVIKNGPDSDLVLVNFEGESVLRPYALDGTFAGTKSPVLFYGPPEIIGPPKPKRMVKKTVDAWMNVYENGEKCVHLLEDRALIAKDNGCLACVHLTGEYTVEED